MKHDSINFTDDLIEGYCQQSGTDNLLMKRMYEFYSKVLLNKVSIKPEVIEAPVKGLGVFFMPLHGVNTIFKRKQYLVKKYQNGHKRYDFYLQRKEHIENRIKKCQECGVSNVKFLYTFISKGHIKNG